MTTRTKRTTTKKRTTRRKATAPTGRPPIIEKGWNHLDRTWTDDAPVGKLLAALRIGSYVAPACAFAGIGTTTRKSWLARGREYVMDDGEPDWATVPEGEQPYVAFVLASGHAEASAEVELVGMVRRAARDDWRAAIALLARRHPERWRERHGIDARVASQPELPPSEALKLLNDPAVRAGMEAIEEALAAHDLTDEKGA